MTLQDSSTIDLIAEAEDGRPNGIDLIIVDAGTIADEADRYAAFIRKLKAYAAYVLSEDLARDYPRTKPRDVRIRLVYRLPPTSQMLEVTAVTPRGDPANRVVVEFSQGPEFPG
ncbi:MAG: hypothetical protein HY303_00550 [Candidatus Wallbacteria bacterium]|nr:hypothetical protein [Candidatus Wallbacteria bacterium]